MKKILIIALFLPIIFLLVGCAKDDSPAVKKSTANICHKSGTDYYAKTKNFTPYNSIDDCLNSGGRLPKK